MPPTAGRMCAIAVFVTGALVQSSSAAISRAAPEQAVRRDGVPVRQGQFRRGFQVPDDVKIQSTFDLDRNGRLNESERRAARQHAESLGLNRGRGGRVPRPPEVPLAGRVMTPSEAEPYPSTPFYDIGTLRTLFLSFENEDWERELMAFKRTDVDVTATLVVDGRSYSNVGVQFHGNSSFSGVPIGLKHSMRLALDFVDTKQDVQGYNTLLLLNSHEDPSFLRTVLAMYVFRQYIPAPHANLIRVVINGKRWGIYANQQQFNKDLIRTWFKTTEGTRWKVPGSPGSRGGGLSYLGDDVSAYKRSYEIKSKDDPEAWASLVELTRLLNTTPIDQLEDRLRPVLDIDGALKFLAVDIALANSDGYWTRASDYSLYRDTDGRFHLLPYDVNTTFIAGGGRGFGGRRGESVTLDPLEAATDPTKSLAVRLLAVPRLREKYLGYVRDVASRWLDWRRLGPVAARLHAAIDADVRTDTRRLDSYDAFKASLDELKDFADRRRAFLLERTSAR